MRRSSATCGRFARAPGVRRTGFTLIELLTVVVIIGILVSLITAAAWRARVTARNATIVAEISDLGMALEAYAAEFGELPPDFTDPQRVLSHLRKRFPRYRLPPGDFTTQWNQFKSDVQAGTGGLDVDQLDPSTALVFWLGGIPDPSSGDRLPKGFSDDKYHPFRSGGSRTKRFLDFDSRRLPDRGVGVWRQYHPQYSSGVPYVYFRARINPATGQWGYVDNNNNPLSYNTNGSAGIAVPYRDGTGTSWREANKFQIVAAGGDGRFGTGTGDRCSESGTNCSEADYDNVTNFSKGVLQDEM